MTKIVDLSQILLYNENTMQLAVVIFQKEEL